MWTYHTEFADLRKNKESLRNRITQKRGPMSLKYLCKKNNFEVSHNVNAPRVQFARGDFYHYKAKDKPNHYVVNLNLLEEVVGRNPKDIDGYVVELLAFAFFDRAARAILRDNVKKNRYLFKPSNDTLVEDQRAAEQIVRYEVNT